MRSQIQPKKSPSRPRIGSDKPLSWTVIVRARQLHVRHRGELTLAAGIDTAVAVAEPST